MGFARDSVSRATTQFARCERRGGGGCSLPCAAGCERAWSGRVIKSISSRGGGCCLAQPEAEERGKRHVDKREHAVEGDDAEEVFG